MRHPVTSREYKVMLRSTPFAGSRDSLLAAAHSFWRDVRKRLASVVIDTDGDLADVTTERVVIFLDTNKHELHAANYVLRLRHGVESREQQVTLKFRHPDRYLAQSRDMAAAGASEARTKFEEDIKAPFVTLHSFSTTAGLDDDRTFRRLEDVARVFADLPKRLDQFAKGRGISAVNDFAARELVLVGGRLQLGRTPRIDAECALIVWYDNGKRGNRPVAVEFSYRYGNKKGEYGGPPSRRAYDVFQVLQTRLPKWVDPKPRTKTAFVYG